MAVNRKPSRDSIEATAARVPLLDEQIETLMAERDAALDVIRGLVRDRESTGGYMPHDEQVRLREARALLAQYGKVVER
ncbi:MAG: hypothetical protein ACTHU0_19265 [Kofleriaceae bacterium]